MGAFLSLLASCSTVSSQIIPSSENTEFTTITGTIEWIEGGTDGESLGIRIADGELIYAIISIPNIGRTDLNFDYKEGDKITACGELWMMGREKHLTVRSFLIQ